MTETLSRTELEARIDYLEEVSRFTIDALEMAASLGDFQKSIDGLQDSSALLAEAGARVSRLIPFEAFGFYLVSDEDAAFNLRHGQPNDGIAEMQEEVDFLIENGTFAWALREKRPVMVASRNFGKQLILHSIATYSRVRGMFVGLLGPEARNIPLVSASLLSIILLNSANALESSDLYRMVEKARDELETRVRERTGELAETNRRLEVEVVERRRAEAALLKAKEAAEGASRAKSAFLANMSHEIRTPMNGAIGMFSLLLETPLTEEQKEYTEAGKNASEALLTIINDVLDFSKIEAGKLTLESIPVRLRDLLGTTLKLFSLRAREKGVTLTCQVHPDVPEVLMGDPGRLRQIIINLVGNAIKFTDRGEVALEVREEEGRIGEETEFHFLVRDTGIGITLEKQGLIFEAFAQGDSSTSRNYGGTGLGLTISSRLVNLMGGRIWVESEAGRGSTFHFTARLSVFRGLGKGLVQAEPSVYSSPHRSSIQTGADPSAPAFSSREGSLPPLKILLAEDNPVNMRLAQRLLEKRGFAVEGVVNGKEALSALERGSYDLVLMDIEMPELDGLQATQAIRQAEKRTVRHIPIVAMTAHAMESDRDRCLSAGMDDYVSKPIRIEELLHAIERATYFFQRV